jgi:hypothetical protein
VTAVLATSLPDNAVIAYGNRQRTFLDDAATRTGRSLLPPHQPRSHAHHHRLTVLEDVSPSLTSMPSNGTWNEASGSWSIEGTTARVNVSLAGPTAAAIAKHPGRVIVFVDYEYAFEQPVRGAVARLEIPLRGHSATARTVSINWQSAYGPLAANSIRVTNASADGKRQKVAEAQHEGQ